MKTNTLFPLIGVLFVFVFFFQGKNPEQTETTLMADTAIQFSKEVRAIIDLKCLGCHNPTSKNEKGKAKLQWDSLALYPKAKQITKLDDVIEVLEKGSMPPAKFLTYKPEAKLTEEEVKLLTEWANATADRLLK